MHKAVNVITWAAVQVNEINSQDLKKHNVEVTEMIFKKSVSTFGTSISIFCEKIIDNKSVFDWAPTSDTFLQLQNSFPALCLFLLLFYDHLSLSTERDCPGSIIREFKIATSFRLKLKQDARLVLDIFRIATVKKKNDFHTVFGLILKMFSTKFLQNL